MDKFKCPKCGATYDIWVKEHYMNEKTQKIKIVSTGQTFTHIVSQDVMYGCSCEKCGNYYEVVGQRREYGKYINDGIYKILN